MVSQMSTAGSYTGIRGRRVTCWHVLKNIAIARINSKYSDSGMPAKVEDKQCLYACAWHALDEG